MANKGTAVIDFGAFPGSNECFVDVADPGIAGASLCDAWIRAEATSDHTLVDHTWAPSFVEVTCGVPTNGVGFRVYATCTEKITGTFNLDWAWA